MTGVPFSLVIRLAMSGACTARNWRGVFEFAWRWRLANSDCCEEQWDNICRYIAFFDMAAHEVQGIVDDPAMSKDAVLLRWVANALVSATPQLTPSVVAVDDAPGCMDVAFLVPEKKNTQFRDAIHRRNMSLKRIDLPYRMAEDLDVAAAASRGWYWYVDLC